MNEFQIPVTSLTTEEIHFELVNVDCTFANAIRRIINDEVPSIAIERVYMRQNTSVIPDEMFAHRLGMIPLNVDPDQLTFCTSDLPDTDDLDGFDPKCHLIFDVKIANQPLNSKSSGDDENNPIHVYSSCLQWVPLPGQEEIFTGPNKPGAVFDAILLAKLNTEDEIIARCVAVKGIGMDHAKFNPSSAAFYNLFPSIKLKGTIRGQLALKLQKSFAAGVIEVDSETQVASVGDPRLDDGSRRYLRDPELKEIVDVSLLSDHFLFTVESSTPGARPPESIVMSAIDIMISKCSYYLTIVEQPGFASTPLTRPNFDIYSVDQDKNSSNSTLNGRPAGVYAKFVSNDLLRGTFVFKGEDHTLGASLRYCVLRRPQQKQRVSSTHGRLLASSANGSERNYQTLNCINNTASSEYRGHTHPEIRGSDQ
nr:DNA directed RNA polymerases I and III subunit [Hymenolepis microstoma]